MLSEISMQLQPSGQLWGGVVSNHSVQEGKGDSSLKAKPPHIPPGWAFPSAPGYLLTAVSVLPHSEDVRVGRRREVNTIVFQWMLGGGSVCQHIFNCRGASKLSDTPQGDGTEGLGALLERDENLGIPGAKPGICTEESKSMLPDGGRGG